MYQKAGATAFIVSNFNFGTGEIKLEARLVVKQSSTERKYKK